MSEHMNFSQLSGFIKKDRKQLRRDVASGKLKATQGEGKFGSEQVVTEEALAAYLGNKDQARFYFEELFMQQSQQEIGKRLVWLVGEIYPEGRILKSEVEERQAAWNAAINHHLNELRQQGRFQRDVEWLWSEIEAVARGCVSAGAAEARNDPRYAQFVS